MTIALPARAKINLELHVVGRRDDGFHDLRAVFQAIDLHDVLFITPSHETVLTTSGFELNAMTPRDNSVLRAQRALEQHTTHDLPARFHLHKRIPPGSGLGGASTDAAAAMRGLIALHRLQLDRDAFLELALEVGADVPFFLTGGTARAEGRGERLVPLPTADRHYALAWPGIELSTAEVYRTWDQMARSQNKSSGSNDLRAAAARVDRRLDEFARKLGSDGSDWRMTGSGSAFFLECTSREEAEQHAKRLDCWNAVASAVPSW